jgi:hypothetical protein
MISRTTPAMRTFIDRCLHYTMSANSASHCHSWRALASPAPAQLHNGLYSSKILTIVSIPWLQRNWDVEHIDARWTFLIFSMHSHEPWQALSLPCNDECEANQPKGDIAVPVSQSEKYWVVGHQSAVCH